MSKYDIVKFQNSKEWCLDMADWLDSTHIEKTMIDFDKAKELLADGLVVSETIVLHSNGITLVISRNEERPTQLFFLKLTDWSELRKAEKELSLEFKALSVKSGY